ncbi:hypothetical protein [Qipengyuania sp. MTN3-11]|uniref:hypothetical protein n=1 Tax=Qipengyuania sp. MTN3-11 TaxID=3056557 RepID=UPI0036F22AA3
MTAIPRLAPAIAFAMLLAACSGADDAPAAEDNSPSPATATPPPTSRPVKPDGGIGDGAGPPRAATTIPADFRGVWDNADGNCNPASDLRMDIRAGEIEFYESLGTVTDVEIESADSIVVSLAMEGEGESWEVTNRYTLSEGGRLLTPLETRDDPRYQPIPRKRCT